MDYEAIGFWIQVVIICALTIVLAVLVFGMAADNLRTKEGRRMVRAMKDVCSTILSCMSPSTPLQKEIREEERTIKQLEKQKRDMQRLEVLTKEREALFEDVGERHVESVEVKRNGVWSEPDKIRCDISADSTMMPESVRSPHECPSCHTEAMMHYPGFEGYDWFCHNCQYKYQYERN